MGLKHNLILKINPILFSLYHCYFILVTIRTKFLLAFISELEKRREGSHQSFSPNYIPEGQARTSQKVALFTPRTNLLSSNYLTSFIHLAIFSGSHKIPPCGI